MELRSSRSRSRTPFVQLTRLEDAKTMSIETREETIVQHYTTRNKSHNSTLSDEVFVTSPVKQRRNRHKTSDYYSSDDCEQEVSSRKSSVETSSKNGEVTSALQVYKDAGEYWNKFPKTDYTYSLNSKDRVELAPGVVCMPNMSRKSLRRSMEPSNYDYETTTTTNANYSDYGKSRYDYYHRNNLERKTLNFEDETDVIDGKKGAFFSGVTKSVTSVTTRCYRSVLRLLMVVYASVASSMLWVARGYYKTVSRLFLFDTWLMQKSVGAAANGSRKYGALIAIMFLPLLLFAGIYFAQAQGISTCYPHCGTIATTYLNNYVDKFYNAVNTP